METKKRNKLDVAISIANCNIIIQKTHIPKEKLLATFLKLKFKKELEKIENE